MLVELQLIKNLKAFNARHAGKVIMQVNCYWNTNVMENHENNLVFLNMSCLIFYCGPHILFWSSLWFISRTGVILHYHATGAEANARWTLLFPRVYLRFARASNWRVCGLSALRWWTAKPREAWDGKLRQFCRLKKWILFSVLLTVLAKSDVIYIHGSRRQSILI